MKKLKVILNPTAGSGYGKKVEPKIREYLKGAGLDFDMVLTEFPLHATELTERALKDGFKIIVAAGGDGTAHEVANGLMEASKTGPGGIMGVIPVGRGSDFAYGVGISSKFKEACYQLAQEQIHEVDVGTIKLPGQPLQYFDNTIGFGFNGVVTVEAKKIKKIRGTFLYLIAVLKTIFFSLKVPLTTITFDEEEMILSALLICVTNGKREGGGFYITPEASMDDGYFDLCIVGNMKKTGMLKLVPHFLKGTHVNKKGIIMARAKKVVISSEDDLVGHADGEIICTQGHHIQCEILPKQLKVIGGDNLR